MFPNLLLYFNVFVAIVSAIVWQPILPVVNQDFLLAFTETWTRYLLMKMLWDVCPPRSSVWKPVWKSCSVERLKQRTNVATIPRVPEQDTKDIDASLLLGWNVGWRSKRKSFTCKIRNLSFEETSVRIKIWTLRKWVVCGVFQKVWEYYEYWTTEWRWILLLRPRKSPSSLLLSLWTRCTLYRPVVRTKNAANSLKPSLFFTRALSYCDKTAH